MKIAIIVVSLVEEAEEYTNESLEEEITLKTDVTKIPWGKSLIRVVVIDEKG